MNAPKVNPWLLAGLGGTLALAFTQRKTIMLFGGKAIDAAHEAIFAAILPERAQPHAGVILRVAREQGLDPFLIFALGDRESGWGTLLSDDGTGDGGHGHGIMQIDDRSFGNWLATHDWADPYTNVMQGARILKGKIAFFKSRSTVPGYTDGSWVFIDASAERLGVSPGKYRDPRPLSGTPLWQASIAAYNTGEGNVLMAIAAGKSPDTTTWGGDYMADVIARASALASTYSKATV